MFGFTTICLSGLLSITNPVFTTNSSIGISTVKDEVYSVMNHDIILTNTSFYNLTGNKFVGGTNFCGTFLVRDAIGRGSQFKFPSTNAPLGDFLRYTDASLANNGVTNLLSRTNKDSTMFSVMDYSSVTTQVFVWNTNFWLYSFKQRTAMVVGNGSTPPYQNSISGAAISPRHVLWPVHAPMGIGGKLLFIDDTNQSVVRTVIATTNLVLDGTYPDIEVVLLDSDLPTTIYPFTILPLIVTNYLPTLDSLKLAPVAIHNQSEIVGEGTWYLFSGTNAFDISQSAHWNPDRDIAITPGDSGGSIMLLVGTNLVLLGHLNTTSGPPTQDYWPDYAALTPYINSAMHFLSTNNFLFSDYQITINDMTPWTVY